jgi:type I restriction enzyme S subunit
MRYEIRKLHEVFTIKKGKKPDLHAVEEAGDIPYLVAKVMRGAQEPDWVRRDDPNAVLVTEDEAIIICDGSNSGEVFSGFSGALSSTMAKIEPKVPIDHVFLRRFLESNAELFAGTKTGAAIPHLDQDAMFNLEIPLPPLPEQRRVVRLLDEAFEKIAIAKANAEKNLQNALALFENQLETVFTQPDATAKELNLSAVCDITSKLVDPRDIAYRSLIHVGAGNIRSKTGEFVNLLEAKDEALISGKFLFDKTMILYSKIRPNLMKVARPNFDGLCSADIYPLSPDEKVITRGYLYYLLLTDDFTEFAVNGSARAGMPKVNRNHLFQFSFLLPAMEKQEIAVEKLDALRVETHRLSDLFRQKCTALGRLKQAMLMQAISGELAVA